MSAVTDQTEVPEAGQMQTTGDLDDDDGGGLVSSCLNLASITSKRDIFMDLLGELKYPVSHNRYSYCMM